MVIPSGINQQDDMNILWGKRRIPDFSDSLFKENCQIAFIWADSSQKSQIFYFSLARGPGAGDFDPPSRCLWNFKLRLSPPSPGK